MRLRIRAGLAGWSLVSVVVVAGCSEAGGPAVRRQDPVPVVDVQVKNLTRDGDLYVGGEPTRQGLQTLRAAGVRTVVDLRSKQQKVEDEGAIARELGMEYVEIPLASNTLTDEQAETFLKSMRGRGRGDVLLHCSGGNRAAAMYGLYLGAEEGYSPEEALRRARKAGLANEQMAEQVRRQIDTRKQARVRPPSPQ